MSLQITKEISCCGGRLLNLSHHSQETQTLMSVNVYLPKQYYTEAIKIPVIYYLSGLTCTPHNASEKAFWQIQADIYGFAIVFPDTSPRGDNIPDDPERNWDFGLGAGFYLDASKNPFSTNYRMYSYVHNELPLCLQQFFNNVNDKLDFLDNVAITGHSMGGCGALVGYLRNINRYKSCSAFSPIVNPLGVPWGQKAFKGYLINSEDTGKQYDPCYLFQNIKNKHNATILIDFGSEDPFLLNQLKPELLEQAISGTTWDGKVKIRLQQGFDHSYYFVSSFVPDHAKFHAKNLGLI